MTRHAFVPAVLGGVMLLMTMGPQVDDLHAGPSRASDQEVRVTELEPGYYVIADDSANLVLYAGGDGSFVAGIQRPSLVARAKQLLESRHAGPVRYVVVMEDSSSLQHADGGWGHDGAVTIAYELLNNRLRPQPKASSAAIPLAPGLSPPVMGFSHVVQVWVGGEEIHAIHERKGYTDADVILHFEKTGMLYLGNTVTMDGYPAIDASRGGTLKGIIDTAADFTTPDWRPERLEPIVPGRGPIATVRDLIAYRDMLITIRDRVRAGVDAGRSLEDIIAGNPTKEFDQRWGRGPVSPAQFVKMVHQSVTQPAARQ